MGLPFSDLMQLKRYGGQWIATKDRQVVAVAPSSAELYCQLAQIGIEVACISFIEDPDHRVTFDRQALLTTFEFVGELL